MSKYVQQDDTLIPVLTVEETLAYSARFYSVDEDVVQERVEDAISMLGLEGQRKTIVGNAILRGLSGGQKRRLSAGNELVASPRILFLDELTSGLDSTAAAAVMHSLHDVAKVKNITMLLTIHQPAEQLFRLSSRLLLLSGGRTAYCGPSAGAVAHFAALGQPVPEMTSSSEYLLDLVNADFSDAQKVKNLVDAWETSPACEALDREMREQKEVTHAPLAARKELYTGTGFARQLSVLTRRVFLNAWRNPLVIWLRLAMYVALSIMIGTVWLQIGDGADVIVDIIGVIFFVAAFMVFMSVSVLPAFLEEKAVFVKERANGAYGSSAFVLAHTIVDLPFMLLQATVCGCLVYFLVGLNDAPGRFGFFLLDLFLSFMVAESIMLVVSSVVPVAIVGIALGAMIYGAFMVVQGFFIKIENVGWWWRWMHYIGMHSYSFSAFMKNEFKGRVFKAVPNASGGPVPEMRGDDVLRMYSFEDTDIWANMAVLVAMVVAYRVIAAWHMHAYHTGKK